MLDRFKNITEEEFVTLKNGVAWITLLIAGADGKIDSNELSWAKKLTAIRSYQSRNDLTDFYSEVGKDFDTYLEKIVNETTKNTEERTKIASEKVAELNPILHKLPAEIAHALYDSFLSFAKHIAKESGSFLRLLGISHDEKKLMVLPMLDKFE